MSASTLPLACMVALITVGEQLRLSRADRSGPAAIAFPVAYGAAALALTASPVAAGLVAVLCAAACWLTERLLATRGPGLRAALSVVVAPYVALWWAWAAMRPAGWPPAVDWVTAAVDRLAVGGTPGPGLAGHVLVLVAAYVFCWGTGTFLTRSVLGGYAAHAAVVTRRQAAHAEVAAAEDPAEQGLLRAGRLIGELERFLTLSLALTGNYTAIAFVVAAKSIARFDLARRHGEYFLVGTLCSIGTALAVGILAAQLLKG